MKKVVPKRTRLGTMGMRKQGMGRLCYESAAKFKERLHKYRRFHSWISLYNTPFSDSRYVNPCIGIRLLIFFLENFREGIAIITGYVIILKHLRAW